MSDGQLAQTHEEWVKTYDELQQLRDKLENIRKKGGWVEKPTEEGLYKARQKGDANPNFWLTISFQLTNDLMIGETFGGRGRGFFVSDFSERYFNGKPIEFARLLTPEDLE